MQTLNLSQTSLQDPAKRHHEMCQMEVEEALGAENVVAELPALVRELAETSGGG